MDVLHALLLGVVEGLTEFLPVSSTGHLLIVSGALGIPQTEAMKSFEIFVQLGAILAVVVYAWREFFSVAVLVRLLAAFVPTAALGLVLHDTVKEVFFESLHLIGWALLVGGVVLIVVEYWARGRKVLGGGIGHIPLWMCALIGVFQSMAMLPGVSRSGASIAGGMLMGLEREVVAKFSFLLAVPTMGAAVVLDVGKGLHRGTLVLTREVIVASGIGFVAAFCVALVVLHVFMAVIKRYGFVPFGVYRIVLGTVVLALLA